MVKMKAPTITVVFMADIDQAGKTEYGAEVECGHFNEYANIDQQDD